MKLSPQENDGMNRAFSSFDEEDKHKQFQDMLDALPKGQGQRFKKSADNAATILGWLSPGIMAFTSSKPVLGVFSSVDPKGVALVAASPKKFLLSSVNMRNFDAHVKRAIFRFEEMEKTLEKALTQEERVNHRGLAIKFLLEEHGIASKRLSNPPKTVDLPVFDDIMVWRSREALEVAQKAAEFNIAVAFVSLVSEDEQTVLSTPFCYARHLPEELLAHDSSQKLC